MLPWKVAPCARNAGHLEAGPSSGSCCGPGQPHSLAEGQVAVSAGLQVLGVIVTGGAQVDAVMQLSHSHSVLPLTGGLVELVQEVVALALLVQLLGLLLEKRGASSQ